MKHTEKIIELFFDKTVLITGGTGFVGKNIQKRLKGIAKKVVAIGSDVYKEGLLSTIMVQDKFDYIFHGAAFAGAGDFPIRFPADQFFWNNKLHVETFDCWRKFQPQAKLIGFGSSCSYPDKPVLLEEDFMTNKLHPSVETYGLSKCSMVQGIEAYKQQYGLEGTTVVFATLYGPHEHFDLEKSHVVAALVKKFCDAVENGDEVVEIWGDGSQKRELIFVDDQVDGMLLCSQYDGKLINAGSGIETSIKELAEAIKEESGFEGELFYNTEQFVGVRRKVLNIHKAKTLYGWEGGQVPMKVGLQKTIEWYRKNEM